MCIKDLWPCDWSDLARDATAFDYKVVKFVAFAAPFAKRRAEFSLAELMSLPTIPTFLEFLAWVGVVRFLLVSVNVTHCGRATIFLVDSSHWGVCVTIPEYFYLDHHALWSVADFVGPFKSECRLSK